MNGIVVIVKSMYKHQKKWKFIKHQKYLNLNKFNKDINISS